MLFSLFMSLVFSLSETQEPKTPVSCQGLWRGGEGKRRQKYQGCKLRLQARQVMKPAGCEKWEWGVLARRSEPSFKTFDF